jgi:GTPase SAR1 family protein
MTNSLIPQTQSNITVFAKTTFRNEQVPFGIKKADRLAHLYIIGKTGTGKSTLIETLITDDLRKGFGVALLDPHGDLVKKIYKKALALRQEDLFYFDAPNAHQPFGFNPLANVRLEKRPLAASGILQVFKYQWQDSWGPRLEHILRNCLLALLDYPNANLADILTLLSDKDFRLSVIRHSTNSQITDFWTKEYENYPSRLRAEAISPIQNKVGAFLSNPILKRILTKPEYPLRLRQIMDEGKVLLVNLAKGSLGEDTANLLGSLLISRFDLAALSRANVPEEERKPFYLYADEFHNFTTQSLAGMLSELRKYKLSMTLSNQFLTQIEPPVRDAILGNVGTIISFRIGTTDAEILTPEFAPEINATDLLSLPNYHIYLKMMVDGKVSKPFSAVTLPPSSPDSS